MRLAALAFGSTLILNTTERTDRVRVFNADRVANGDAFPGEIVVRIPRRLSREIATRPGSAYYFRYPGERF